MTPVTTFEKFNRITPKEFEKAMNYAADRGYLVTPRQFLSIIDGVPCCNLLLAAAAQRTLTRIPEVYMRITGSRFSYPLENLCRKLNIPQDYATAFMDAFDTPKALNNLPSSWNAIAGRADGRVCRKYYTTIKTIYRDLFGIPFGAHLLGAHQ